MTKPEVKNGSLHLHLHHHTARVAGRPRWTLVCCRGKNKMTKHVEIMTDMADLFVDYLLKCINENTKENPRTFLSSL